MGVDEQIGWLENSVGVRRLDDRAVVAVSGDDAREWLQGQITNQLEGVQSGGSVYGFVLTLKGRILADVWVLARDDDFFLDVPTTQVEPLLERLDRYIIMEDVDLIARKDARLVTAQGPLSERLDGGWPVDRLGLGGRLWVVEQDEEHDAIERIASTAEALGGGEVGAEAWSRAHVLRGRPRFGVDFGQDTYPQESGLTPVAVSFNKGCYIGQETVVMLENRGKAPKVLWRWRVERAAPPEPGSPILKEGTAVGEVTSAVAVDGDAVAFGYLKRGHEAGSDGTWAIGGHPAAPIERVADGLSSQRT